MEVGENWNFFNHKSNFNNWYKSMRIEMRRFMIKKPLNSVTRHIIKININNSTQKITNKHEKNPLSMIYKIAWVNDKIGK